MKKKILITIAILAVIIVSTLSIATLKLDDIIKTAINTIAPELTGVPTSVEKVDVNITAGSVEVLKAHLGVPDGFEKIQETFSCGEIFIDVGLSSLLSDTIVIDEIRIKDLKLSYEKSSLFGSKSNIDVILADLINNEAEIQEEVQEAQDLDETSSTSKKIFIKKIVFEDGQASVYISGVGSTIPLGSFELDNLSSESPTQAVAKIMNAYLNNVLSQLVKGINLDETGTQIKDGANDIGTTVKDTFNKLLNF